MHQFNKVVLNYEPRKKILPQIPVTIGRTLMSEFDSSFICGLLKEHKPKKILEIGVAAGGSTAIILQCLEDVKHDSNGGGQLLHMNIICIR